MTQTFDELEPLCGSDIPKCGFYVDQRELNWTGAPELLHLADLCRAACSELPDEVKGKYLRTVDLYRKRFPRLVECIEKNDFDISSVVPDASWKEPINKHPESYAYAIERRLEF